MNKGQQPNNPEPQRRDYSHLPEIPEDHTLPEEQCQCKTCGLPFAPVAGTEDSTILEIEVQPHRRTIRRHRYRPTCECPEHPGLITAPTAPRVIPNSIFGVSIWVTILLDKYPFYRPTYRLLEDLRTHQLDRVLSSLTDGLKRLLPLFEPLYEAMIDHSRHQTLWHADETRWQVFATTEGKASDRWWLWVFHSQQVVVFVLDPGRAHQVPEEFLGPCEEGIVVSDRYKAYPAIDQVKNGGVVVAFCWAHVRRDFLSFARSYPNQEEWAMGWIGRIGEIYHHNDQRLEALGEGVEQFVVADEQLRDSVAAMARQRDLELSHEDLPSERRKVLQSLCGHWKGLTVLVEHASVPMDNNTAERSIRGPVLGRKNYRGGGSLWSGQLAAMLFSLFQTLCLWKLNPREWLSGYLTACAESGGKPPADPENFLPWNLSEEQFNEGR